MGSPDFTHPPVVEVALSVQFAPLQAMTTAHVAHYWESIRDRFPGWTEARPIDQVVEMFGAPRFGLPRFAFNIEGGVVPHRALFQDAAGAELVQVQRDRFVRNWRRHTADGAEYPRFPTLRKKFEADLDKFIDFSVGQDLGVPEFNQCEITYVNHLPAGEGWARQGEVHKVLGILGRQSSDDFLPEPENVEATFRYVFPWPDEREPAGRLHVKVSPMHRLADGAPLIAVTLTARGRPRGTDAAAALRWMDVGHDFLVNAFASMTRPEMHKLWGRSDVR
ncbi:MAG: TIGR04255 family protein [Myxococcota bacterium]